MHVLKRRNRFPLIVVLATTIQAAAGLGAGAPGIDLRPAQTPAPGTENLLTPIDQGVADLTANSTSLRQVERGINVPTSFADLYQITGRPDLLLRADNGVYAVFPESEYARYRGAAIPLIPLGTKYYIGRDSLGQLLASPFPSQPSPGNLVPTRPIQTYVPPALAERPPAPPAAIVKRPELVRAPNLLVDLKSDLAPVAIQPAADAQESPQAGSAPMSIVNNAAYRGARVRYLLMKAVQAAEARPAAN